MLVKIAEAANDRVHLADPEEKTKPGIAWMTLCGKDLLGYEVRYPDVTCAVCRGLAR